MKRLIWGVVIGVLLAPTTARAQDVVIYYHTDAIGSVRAITDENGAELARYDFLPFGERWGTTPTADPRMFAGKERDETELDYFGARYFRAQSGRFTTVDPALNIATALTDPQRWNRYTYAVNRPFVMVDPDGREAGYLYLSNGRMVAPIQAMTPTMAKLWGGTLAVGAAAMAGLGGGALITAAENAIGQALLWGGSRAAIGYASGTGGSAFVADRLQHASHHLTGAGILGNWSKATGQRFTEMGSKILENPTATFDYVLKGGEAAKGFLGKVDGRNVVFFVYKAGERAGEIATAIVPSADQLAKWGLR